MQFNKKTILALCIGFYGASNTFAQQKNVVSAINYLGYYNKDKDANDLMEAKKYIDLATLDAETGAKAKTWSNRAEIYMLLYNCKDAKVADLKNGSLDEAAKAYAQTVKLDEKNNYPQAKDGLKICAIIAYNQGNTFYDEAMKSEDDATKTDRFTKAVESYEKSIFIHKNNLKSIDSNAVYNAAISALAGKNYDKAISYFQEAIDLKYGANLKGPKLYSLLSQTYKLKGDVENYKSSIVKGRTLYPNDGELLEIQTNMFIVEKKYKEAIDNIDLAVSKDPKNEQLLFRIGLIYDNLTELKKGESNVNQAEIEDYLNKAEIYYKKALEINPEYFDAIYGLGVLYYNKAVKLNEELSNIKDQKKYDAANAKVDEAFKKSLPIMEKGEEIRTNDYESYKVLLSSLQKLYLMTEQTEKSVAAKGRLAGGPNKIIIGDEIAAVEEKLGKPLKIDSTKGKFYTSDVLDYPEYTLYMDGGFLTKWVKK
jgi:tetratricopeptide (TPR) repeat protein